MTSISAGSTGQYQSPLQRLQQELQSEVSGGTISSSDQSALATALQDIDTALQQSRSSDQSSGTRPSGDGLKSKIDDLIAGEVSNGTLTSDQADELKGVFQSAFANGAGKGPRGPGGAGGPPPGPPPSDDGSSDATSPVDAASSSSTESSTAKILEQFLQALQQSQSASSSYGANGTTTASSNSDFSALLIDYKS